RLLVERCLKALAIRYDSDRATVDKKLFNAARIGKLPDTWARKGQDTPERPHRRAGLLEVSDHIRVVPLELLQALAAEAPTPLPPPAQATTGARNSTCANGTFTRKLDVEQWLNARGVSYRKKPRPDRLGRDVYVLATCPFDRSHSCDSCVMQGQDGR